MLIDEPNMNRKESKHGCSNSMQQSPSFRKMESLDNEGNLLNSQGHAFTRLNSANRSSTQSLEHRENKNVVKQLKSNIERLEKLEKRLMKGKHNKKTSRITSLDSQDNYQLMDANRMQSEVTGKNKKGKKNWRFAYDLYCKEIITSNHQGIS
jgi:hypothetical protein